jgi:hypothetical protein
MTAWLAIPAGERVSLRQCADVLGIHPETARKWCEELRIGCKVPAPFPRGGEEWRISFPAARMVYARDFAALEALQAGDRKSAVVAPYLAQKLEHCGAVLTPDSGARRIDE